MCFGTDLNTVVPSVPVASKAIASCRTAAHTHGHILLGIPGGEGLGLIEVLSRAEQLFPDLAMTHRSRNRPRIRPRQTGVLPASAMPGIQSLVSIEGDKPDPLPTFRWNELRHLRA